MLLDHVSHYWEIRLRVSLPRQSVRELVPTRPLPLVDYASLRKGALQSR